MNIKFHATQAGMGFRPCRRRADPSARGEGLREVEGWSWGVEHWRAGLLLFRDTDRTETRRGAESRVARLMSPRPPGGSRGCAVEACFGGKLEAKPSREAGVGVV